MSHSQDVHSYWDTAERRDWEAFGELLAEDVVYRLPQTGEQVTGRSRYLRFNIEFPGDWHISVERVVADDDGAASWVTSTLGGVEQSALTFFRFDAAGRISLITDFWPEPYDAPVRPQGLVDHP